MYQTIIKSFLAFSIERNGIRVNFPVLDRVGLEYFLENYLEQKFKPKR